MNLREYLRNEWSQYIRPIMVKDECEFCGSKEELHLHHIDRFHNMLVETLEELQLQELDTEYYGEMELKMISNFMLAKQIKSEYKTLCRSCHMRLHAKEKFTDEYKNHYYNPNGGYIMINTDKMLDLNIENKMLARFLMIACHCNYDGYLSEKRRKVKIDKIGTNDFIKEILNLKKTELYQTLNYLKDNELIIIEEDMLKINSQYSTKGFNNYKKKTKIFIENFIDVYKNIDTKRHKIFGDFIFEYLFKESINWGSIVGKTNRNRIKEYTSDMEKFCKIRGKYIIINPRVIYDGALDYSYKDIIDDWDKS